jgi:hypothetical protein
MTDSSKPDPTRWEHRALRAMLHDVAGRLGVLRLAADLADLDEAEIPSFHRMAVGALADLDEWLKAARALLQVLERPPVPPVALDVLPMARQALSTVGGETALERGEPGCPHAGDPQTVALVIGTVVRELRRVLPEGRLTVRIEDAAEEASSAGPADAPGPLAGVITITCAAAASEPDLSAGAVSPLIIALCTELLGRQAGTLVLRRGSANEFTVRIRLPLWGASVRAD